MSGPSVEDFDRAFGGSASVEAFDSAFGTQGSVTEAGRGGRPGSLEHFDAVFGPPGGAPPATADEALSMSARLVQAGATEAAAAEVLEWLEDGLSAAEAVSLGLAGYRSVENGRVPELVQERALEVLLEGADRGGPEAMETAARVADLQDRLAEAYAGRFGGSAAAVARETVKHLREGAVLRASSVEDFVADLSRLVEAAESSTAAGRPATHGPSGRGPKRDLLSERRRIVPGGG